jgi:glycosyltransferase involved in cell wall biosynthesis
VATVDVDRPEPGTAPEAGAGWSVPSSADYLRQPAVRRAAAGLLRLVAADLPLAWRLARLAAARCIHILHANDRVGSNRFVALAGWLAGVPVIQHERLAAPYRWPDRLACRSLAATLCVSASVRDAARRSGHQGRRLLVIPNAVAAPPQIEPLRNGRPRVGIVGRLVPWKGQDLFLEAMAQVAPRHPQARFYVLGAAPGGASSAFATGLREQAAREPLGGRVEFTGFLPDPWPVLAGLDALVVATRTPEPFGRTLIEAMSLGVPVVAPAAGGPLDIVEDGETGLLYPPNDAVAMGNLVSTLLANRELALRLGAAGREVARERYQPAAHARAIEAIYDGLLPVEV